MVAESESEALPQQGKNYRSMLYFQDVFFTLEATRRDSVGFLTLHDSALMEIFENEIRSIIERNMGQPVRAVRIGSRLGGNGWGYIEFQADGENYHVAPRVFVYEHPRYNAQSVVMKSYEEEKKNWYK